MVKILGINDDVTTCECCGKSNLKKTVVLNITDAIVHYGVNCAARRLLKSKATIESLAITAQSQANSITHYIIHNDDLNVWVGGLYPKRFNSIEEANQRLANMPYKASIHPCFS
jgi:hypothetical protein